jgi:hypothetical protein
LILLKIIDSYKAGKEVVSNAMLPLSIIYIVTFLSSRYSVKSTSSSRKSPQFCRWMRQ